MNTSADAIWLCTTHRVETLRQKHVQSRSRRRLSLMTAALAFLAACTPTVKLEAPEDPIVINLNVTIEQEVRVRIEREVDDLLRENEDLF